jgi:dihydrofolate synthase/folylpolyglutamate synthase
MDFNDALLYLNSLLRFGPKLGLERFTELCRRFGNPQDNYRVVHVAGTKGKGSTTAMAAAILQSAGYHVGGYFSPYVFDLCERVQVDGTPIPRADFARMVAAVRPVIEELTETEFGQTTEFELKTLVAFLYFAERGVDYACVEVGLGGRLDATNVVKPAATVITNIGLDHTQILGDTHALIAAEKAGIIKPGIPLFTAANHPEAFAVIERIARERSAPLARVKRGDAGKPTGEPASVLWSSDGPFDPATIATPEHVYRDIDLAMAGEYQRENAACAVAAVEVALKADGKPLEEAAVRAGLASATLPGRLTQARLPNGALLVLDGAHNGMAALALAGTLEALKRKQHIRQMHLVTGMVSGHAPEEILGVFAPSAAAVYTCAPAWKRAIPVEETTEAARRFNSVVRSFGSVPEAIQAAVQAAGPRDMVLVTGSFYTVGETPAELLQQRPAASSPGRAGEMRIIDLSQPIFDAGPNCPAHPMVRSEVTKRHPEADWCWETLTLASHTGSHLDAPLHKLQGGASIDAIPLERFTGPAYIADLRGIGEREFITSEMLRKALPADLPPDSIVLMATGWGDVRERSDHWLYNSPKLAPEAAEWLVERKIRGLGVDHWGIGGWDAENDAAVHTILLSKGIWICEELKFSPEVYVLPMPQQFMALPINLRGHSGAWCRPIFLVSPGSEARS